MGKAINDRTITAPWWNGPKSPTVITVQIFIIWIVTVMLCLAPTLIAMMFSRNP